VGQQFGQKNERTTPYNIMYKTLGFKWLLECFYPASAFATADSDEARNPQRFIHVTVGTNITRQNPHENNTIDLHIDSFHRL
jgi:hypothetical protein